MLCLCEWENNPVRIFGLVKWLCNSHPYNFCFSPSLQNSYTPYISQFFDEHSYLELGNCSNENSRKYISYYKYITNIQECTNYCSSTSCENSAYIRFEYAIWEKTWLCSIHSACWQHFDCKWMDVFYHLGYAGYEFVSWRKWTHSLFLQNNMIFHYIFSQNRTHL